MEIQAESNHGVPDWAMKPLKTLLDDLERLARFPHLCMKAILMIQTDPNVIEMLARVKTEPPTDFETRLNRAQKEAELAQSELDTGFPLLHMQATMAMWASLEAAMRHFVANWVRYGEGAKNVEVIQKLKIRLGDYEALDEEERAFFIVDSIEKEINAPFRRGVDRFESLLKPFGLSGPIEDQIKDTLFEISQVRNVLMHRYGVADRRFVENCPWLGLKPGDHVQIRQPDFDKYLKATADYVIILLIRIGERFGQNVDEFKDAAVLDD